MKPQLANDADLATLPYPNVTALPKIDGVRAMNLTGTLTGRSLDPFKGFGITEFFSKQDFVGLDGEMTLGSDPCAKRLCSLTTGAMSRIYVEGTKKLVTEMADLHWHIFDFVTPETLALPYEERWELAWKRVEALDHPRIHMVAYQPVDNHAMALEIMAKHLDLHYEGTIWRNSKAPAKQGRPGKKTQEYVRSKPWADFEIMVTGVTEGSENTNEAKKNSLGRTERSFAKDGLVPNGMIGSLQGITLDDVKDHNGKVLFPKGLAITAGPGEMTDIEAAAWFKDQTNIVGHIAKIKHMTFGVKDLPRFPTFLSKRLPQDMSR